MQIIVSQNKGVTLVEVMVALTVLLIVFLGLIQTSIVAIQANMRNALRDEAVKITSGEMASIRVANFDDLNEDGAIDPTPIYLYRRTETRNYRGTISVPFALQVRAEELSDPATGSADNKQITITTTWAWQGENFQHQILTTRVR